MCPQRQIGHLVKEDHPAMRLFQQARLYPTVRGFAAKQHFFHAVWRHTGAVDRHERGRGPVGIGMDIARGDLFARPRRAAQHHPTVRLRDLVKLPHQRFECGRAADHIGAGDLAPFEAVVLAT